MSFRDLILLFLVRHLETLSLEVCIGSWTQVRGSQRTATS